MALVPYVGGELIATASAEYSLADYLSARLVDSGTQYAATQLTNYVADQSQQLANSSWQALKTRIRERMQNTLYDNRQSKQAKFTRPEKKVARRPTASRNFVSSGSDHIYVGKHGRKNLKKKSKKVRKY